MEEDEGDWDWEGDFDGSFDVDMLNDETFGDIEGYSWEESQALAEQLLRRRPHRNNESGGRGTKTKAVIENEDPNQPSNASYDTKRNEDAAEDDFENNYVRMEENILKLFLDSEDSEEDERVGQPRKDEELKRLAASSTSAYFMPPQVASNQNHIRAIKNKGAFPGSYLLGRSVWSMDSPTPILPGSGSQDTPQHKTSPESLPLPNQYITEGTIFAEHGRSNQALINDGCFTSDSDSHLNFEHGKLLDPRLPPPSHPFSAHMQVLAQQMAYYSSVQVQTHHEWVSPTGGWMEQQQQGFAHNIYVGAPQTPQSNMHGVPVGFRSVPPGFAPLPQSASLEFQMSRNYQCELSCVNQRPQFLTHSQMHPHQPFLWNNNHPSHFDGSTNTPIKPAAAWRRRDPHRGLMTSRDKLRLRRIQLLQLHLDQPFTTDHYDLMLKTKQTPPGQDSLKRELLLKLFPNHYSQPTKFTKIPYVPIVFEKCLGKLQVASSLTPRRVIDTVIRVTESSTTSRKQSSADRRLLLEIEELYMCLLQMEESDIRVSILCNGIEEDLVKRIRSEEKFVKVLANHMKMRQILSINKGKVLLCRLLPLLSKSLRYKTLGFLMQVYPLWGNSSIDAPFTYLRHCILQAEISDLLATIQFVSSDYSSTIEAVVKTKLGISILSCVFHQAETVLSKCDEALAEYLSYYWTRNSLNGMMTILEMHDILAVPLEVYPNMLQHVRRFGLPAEKFQVLEAVLQRWIENGVPIHN